MDRNNVHVSLWYKDKQEEPGAPPLGPQAHGVAVNANFMVGPDHMVFLRGGWSDGFAINGNITAGFGWRPP
jgi:porin